MYDSTKSDWFAVVADRPSRVRLDALEPVARDVLGQGRRDATVLTHGDEDGLAGCHGVRQEGIDDALDGLLADAGKARLGLKERWRQRGRQRREAALAAALLLAVLEHGRRAK